MADPKSAASDQYKGFLYKWTNYLKGYQKRWFVLQNGLLSYYRNQAEMMHTCRGTINLANAFIHTEDQSTFVISNGGTQTFHLKAGSEVERQRWVTALELAKAKAVQRMESDEEDDDDVMNQLQTDRNELQTTLRLLSGKLEDLTTCNELISKHGSALQKSLNELEQSGGHADSVSVAPGIKAVNERATLFRITSNAMINACREYSELAQSQGRRWQRMLQYEHEQRVRLEEMVEQLAKQHSSFEKKARRSLAAVNFASSSASLSAQSLKNAISSNQNANILEENSSASVCFATSDEEDEFHDAVDDYDITVIPQKTSQSKSHKRNQSAGSVNSFHTNLQDPRTENYDSSGESDYDKAPDPVIRPSKTSNNSLLPVQNNTTNSCSLVKRKRRTRIPEKPNYSINLWSIMKNCIGKELTKIPMPVNFSEPLSFLQRLTEDFEYSSVLDNASYCEDSCEQLAHVAAFTISAFAITTNRIGKPFNPLLGETFECDRREDLGWRAFSEQVCHHPPTCAMHAEGRDWTSWQEFTMSSKFRGKYLQIIPLGIAHLRFNKSGNHYTWRKVTTTVHNIIVGKLWADHHGEMDIVNHKTGDKCTLKYSAYSYFSRETPRKVTGVITDQGGVVRWVIQGTWDEKIEGSPVLNTIDNGKGKIVYETGQSRVLWQRVLAPHELEKCYNFTRLAVELNEPEPGVCPTDSRLRPDQRFMEEGLWTEADKCKIQLEEKQRATRRKREAEAAAAASEGRQYQGYESVWFRKETDPQTGNVIHTYTNEYWQCKENKDWSRCPNIFLN